MVFICNSDREDDCRGMRVQTQMSTFTLLPLASFHSSLPSKQGQHTHTRTVADGIADLSLFYSEVGCESLAATLTLLNLCLQTCKEEQSHQVGRGSSQLPHTLPISKQLPLHHHVVHTPIRTHLHVTIIIVVHSTTSPYHTPKTLIDTGWSYCTIGYN